MLLFYRTSREGMINQNPIYGPPAKPPVHPKKTNSGGSKSGKSVGGPYPDIFGPDATRPIGEKGTNPKEPEPEPDAVPEESEPPAESTSPCELDSKYSAVYVNPVGPGVVASDQSRGCKGSATNPYITVAFPYDGPPQPFLSDFSKILH